MERRQLDAFVTLSEELNFTRAAARLSITQSALSQQLARIEQDVGVKLFQRSSRRVAHTVAGAAFLPEARAALRQLDAAVETARRAASGELGSLSLGFADAAPLSVLPGLVSRFRAVAPEVRLTLGEMLSAAQADAIVKGQLDAGILRPVFDRSALSSCLIWREPYVVALPVGHELAAREHIEIADLGDIGFIATSPEKARYIDGVFRGALARARLRPRIVQEANQLPAVAALVGAGLGAAFMPSSAARLTLEGVVYRPLAPMDRVHGELFLAWRSQEPGPALMKLIAVARGMGRSDRDGPTSASSATP